MRRPAQISLRLLLIPTAINLAIWGLVNPAHAQEVQRSEYVMSLVDRLHQLEAEHPEVIAANLQKVKDTMAQASPARRQQAIWDNSRYSANVMTDSARGGLPQQFFNEMGRIGGEYSNPFMNAGVNSPGALHDVGKSASGFRRPCSAEIGGVTALVGCSGSNSFPSGHTSKGTGANLLAAYLFPERFQQFVTRAQQYGESRLIVGVHYPLDVMAARAMTYKAVADLLAEQAGDPNSWLNASADPTGMRQRVLDACNGRTMQACADDSAATGKNEFDDHAANKAYYDYTKYYGFAPIGPTDVAMVVPENAEYLIKSRFPYLNDAQLREVIRTTADPSGQVLDDAWSRINLFAAADGYGALDGDVTVTLDAARAGDQTLPGAGYFAADTWRNDIGGSGSLTKAGSGSLTLTGDNRFAGFALEAGSLRLNGRNQLSGSSRVTGGTLELGSGSSLHTGGDLQVSSDGQLLLNETRLGAAGRLDVAGTAQLAGAATFDVAAAGEGTISGVINGAGALYKEGAGTLSLSGDNRYAGGTRVGAGTLSLEHSNAAGSGDITLEDGTTLAYADGINVANRLILDGGDVALKVANGRATQSGDIAGNGSYSLTGAGQLDITGDLSDFDGQTRISGTRVTLAQGLGGSVDLRDQGVLVANGNATARVAVGNGGTLEGSGSIGGLSVAAGGTVSPGNSIGTLHVNGDVAFQPGASYRVEVDPASGAADRIAATGQAALNGGTVTHIGATGGYDLSSTYTILTADQGVEGKFGAVSSDFAFLTPTLSYGKNDVRLTLDRNAVGLAEVAETANQRGAARALGDLGRGNGLFDAVVQLNQPDARTGFSQASGELHAATLSAFAEDARLVRDAANTRLRAALGAQGTDSSTQLANDAGTGGSVWLSSFGSWGELEGGSGVSDLNRSSKGMLIGADAPIGGGWRAGAFTGYSRSDAELKQAQAKSESDSYHLGTFAGTHFGNWTFSSGASYSWHDVDSRRTLELPGFADRLTGNYDSTTLQAFTDLGYGFDVGAAVIEPFVNLAYVDVKADAHDERGGAAALHTDRQSYDATLATTGLRASGAFATQGTAPVSWYSQLGWRSSLDNDAPTVTQRFVGGATPFQVEGASLTDDALVVEAGLQAPLSTQVRLGLGYTGQFSSQGHDQGANLSLNWRF